MEARVLGEPSLHFGRFVRPVVVEHEMQVEAFFRGPVDLAQELQKHLMPVAGLAVANDKPGGNIECREQGRCAVTLVVVRHGGCAARLRAVERLDLAPFINAQHQSLVRRVHVEPDDIDGLLLELRIVGDLEGLDEVRLDPGLAPDPLNARVADAHLFRHRLHRPVRRIRRRLGRRLGQNLGFEIIGLRLASRRARLGALQAFDAFFEIAPLPAPDRRLVLSGLAADRARAQSARRRKDNLCPPDDLGRRVPVRGRTLKRPPLVNAHCDCGAALGHGGIQTDLPPQVVPSARDGTLVLGVTNIGATDN